MAWWGGVVATRTRIHGCHEHEARGIVDLIARTRHADDTVFERLAEHFEDRARKFGKLVQEKDAVVRERDLARQRMRATADHGDG